jgi:uncharacterized 2Fe-2S/4Fe-4S cluster protein (DUF4445 family)
MATIVFRRAGQEKKVKAASGESLLVAARNAGVLIDSPCNGNGTCGKCKVKIINQGTKETVLACRTEVHRDVVVEIPEHADSADVQIKQDGMARTTAIDSAFRKEYIATGKHTRVYHCNQLIAVEPGDTASELFGLVVDIGTTTLVAALVDLTTGTELAATGALNPQSRLAQDVLSRIRYSSNEEGLAEMQQLFIDELNGMIQQVTAETKILPSNIYELVFSGNTCMLHLATKTSPVSLGKYPYTPVIRGGELLSAAKLGIYVAASALVYLPPIVSAYVGADITAGVMAAGLDERQENCLFIDIGTNGEMVLAAAGRLVATSTAAGPAFEGMNISQGMRAAPGAIEGFKISDGGDRLATTIGGAPAVGICGSGLLDIVAQLVSHGLVNRQGKFHPPETGLLAASLVDRDGKTLFEITEGVYLSQQDIRQVQLAKGAIRAGIEALLAHCRISAEQVDRVLIAGSFGYHLDPESLLAIGLLPEQFRGNIEFWGNTSKTGGQAFLVNQQLRRRIEKTVEDISVLELANQDNFDRLFVKCLQF